jgi:outer membrane cobalamin receptor
MKIYFSVLLLIYSTLCFSETIRGKVVNLQGIAVPLANVIIDQTSIGTTTASDGSFSLDVSTDQCTLMITHIAYKTVSIALTEINDQPITVKFEKEKDIRLNEMVITVTKSETRPEFVPQPVAQISAAEVARRFTYNVGEMLDQVPGIRIIRSGGTIGAEQGISVRSLNGGPGSDKTLILVDGRPMNNALDGSVNFNSLPTEMAERVEVVKGPSSALYGSQATAGVINVITRVPQQGLHNWISVSREFDAAEAISSTAATGYGRPNVHAYNLQWAGSYRNENMSHTIAVGYRDAQNTFPNQIDNAWKNADVKYGIHYTLSEQLALSGRVDYHWNKWHNEADATKMDDDDKIFGIDLGTQYLASDFVINGRVYMNYAKNKNTILSTTLSTGSIAARTGLMADVMLPVHATSGVLRGGIDGYLGNADVDYTSTVMEMNYLRVDTVIVKNKKKAIDLFSGVYGSKSQSYSMNNIALFLQYEQKFLNRINIVAGARLDRHSEFGTVITPKAGATVEVLRFDDYLTTVKANYGTGFRAPSMNNLFSKSLSGYGNPDMNPEKVESIDLGVFQRFAEFGYLEISWYRMNVTNLMINDKLGSTGNGYYVLVPKASGGTDTLSFNQRKNLGNYSPSGVEISAKIQPEEHVTLFGGYTYLDPEDFTFQTSKYRWNIGITGWYHILGTRVEAEVIHNYTGDGYFFDYHSSPYAPFTTTDATFSIELTPVKLSLVGRNLADTRYRLWNYFWQPGRTFAIRIETQL